MKSQILACPECCSSLDDHGSHLICQQCRRTFSLKDGIIDFRVDRHDYYFNPVPRAEMRRLNADFESQGWDKTVRNFLSYVRVKKQWWDNICADGRYSWKIFLELGKPKTVLDLGCGLGNLSQNIAPHVGRTFAMDLTLERLQFARNRFETFNREDDIVLIAGGDGRFLPFADGTIDLICLSGVLEWVGEGPMEHYRHGSKLKRLLACLASPFGARSPRSIQVAFLKEIHRVLRPDGQLFVAIENRLNYEYFLGRPDHHSVLKYASLMPRVAANLYSTMRARRPYRTYTYSLAGYRRLMKRGGFPYTEFLGFMDGYSFLRRIIPLAGPFRSWQPETAGAMKERLRTNKWLVPAYGIIAKGAAAPSRRMIDRICEAAEQLVRKSRGVEGRLSVHRYEISQKQKLICHCSIGEMVLVLRLPFSAAGIRGEQVNAKLLRWLEGNHPPHRVLPMSLGSGEVDGQPFFLEGKVSGEPIFRVVGRDSAARFLRTAFRFLEELNSSEALERVPLDDRRYGAYVARRLEKIAPLLERRSDIQHIDGVLRRTVHGRELAWGVMHGDYSASNVLTLDRAVSGVIDWEYGRRKGIPALDAVSMTLSLGNSTQAQTDFSAALVKLCRWDWPEAEAAELKGYYDRSGLDRQLHPGVVILYWLKSVEHRLASGLGTDPSGVQRYIRDVVSALKEH